MKLMKSLFALFMIIAFTSCNTPNRPNINSIVEGTPTNADTVLYRSQVHANDSLAKPHETPRIFNR